MSLPPLSIEKELNRIAHFLRESLKPSDRVVVFVSGGLDSEVVVRLLVAAGYSNNLQLVFVHQDHQEPRFLANAESLKEELQLPLLKVDLRGVPGLVLSAICAGCMGQGFDTESPLDLGRVACALRTVIASSLQDRGHVIVGTSNKTEQVLGFYLPFGDGLWHIGPLAHLYKSEVFELARHLGTSRALLEQAPSAGFWEGQDDLTDIAYWLHNGGPIVEELKVDECVEQAVAEIRSHLSYEDLDTALNSIELGSVTRKPSLPDHIQKRLRALVVASRGSKHRPLLKCLARTHEA